LSITPLLQRHEAVLDALQARLDALPEPLWTWRPEPGAWCAAEVYDHVHRIARLYSFPKLEACLEGAGRAGGSRTALGWLVMAVPPLAGAFKVRRDFPEELLPSKITQEAARLQLEELRALARQAAPRVGADPGLRRARHVSLGWLTAQQWYAFAAFHHRHHLEGQLARLLAAPDRPRA
jgi:hypothetical protein